MNNNNNNNSGEATPPYRSWNQIIEEEELDYEEEVITISDSEEDSTHIREEPPEVEEWGTPRWENEVEDDSEAEDDAPEFASQWGDQTDASYGGAGEGGQPEQPPQDEPPSTQCFRNWWTEVQEVGNVRVAHLQVNYYERIVMSNDNRMTRARLTPPPGCAVEDGHLDDTRPPTPGRQSEESKEVLSHERPQTPNPEVVAEGRPPTPRRKLYPRPPHQITSPPKTQRPAPPPGFDEEDPDTWPTELRYVLEALQEEYLLGEQTGRTRVKRNIDGVFYRSRVRDGGTGRVVVLEK